MHNCSLSIVVAAGVTAAAHLGTYVKTSCLQVDYLTDKHATCKEFAFDDFINSARFLRYCSRLASRVCFHKRRYHAALAAIMVDTHVTFELLGTTHS